MDSSQALPKMTPEEVECIEQWVLSNDPPPPEDEESMLKTALSKAKVLVDAFKNDSLELINNTHLIPGKEREGRLREYVESSSILMQMGFKNEVEYWLDQVWHKIAIHLSSEQNGRGPEAQKILLELLLKSIGRDDNVTFFSRLCTLAGILNDQDKHAFAARLFKTQIILCQGEEIHGCEYSELVGTKLRFHKGGNVRVRKQLARCLSMMDQNEDAEAWNWEHCHVWDAALEREGEGEVTLREASVAYKGLGDTLFSQKKDDEAEIAFQRALDLKLKQTGLKPVLMSLLEIKDLPLESLEHLLQEQGIRIPSGTEKGHLANLLYEKAVKDPQHPIDDEDTMAIMKELAGALHFQKKHPEKLPRAEVLYRQALAAMKILKYGQEHEDTLQTMLTLSDCLAKQFKFDEAIDIAQKVLAGWKVVAGEWHPNYKLAQSKLREMLHAQQMMKKAVKRGTNAKKKRSPPHSSPREEGGHPAAVKYQAELHQMFKDQMAKERASSSTHSKERASSSTHSKERISSKTKPKVQMDYDPTDECDTNWAALLALMGAREWTIDKDQPDVHVQYTKCPKFSREMEDPQDRQAYTAILGALKVAMESKGKLPSGSPGTLEHKKMRLLERRYASELQQDAHAKEAVQDLAERFSEARIHQAEIANKKPRSKPVKICIGCGKSAAKMHKCSKCRMVYACSQACWISAWRSSHKRLCCGGKEAQEAG